MNPTPVSFKDLHIDLLYHSFKYLSLKERIAFERVSKFWDQILTSLWLVQKVFAFRKVQGRHELEQIKCPFVCHLVRDCDIFISNWDYEKAVSPEVTRNALSRCKNLRSLILMTYEAEMTSDLGSILGRACPKLEHLSMRVSSLPFEVFMNFLTQVKYENVNLKCLEIGEMSMVEDKDSRFRSLHKDMFPFLESLSIFKAYFNPLLVNFVSQLKSLTGYHFKIGCIKALSDQGHNLVEFRCFGYLSEREVSLICENLSNLKSLQVDTCFKNLKYIQKLDRLEKLSWFETCCTQSHSNSAQPQVADNLPNGFHQTTEEEEAQDEDEDRLEVSDLPANSENLSQMVSKLLRVIGYRLNSLHLGVDLAIHSVITLVLNHCPNLTYFGLDSDLDFSQTLINLIQFKTFKKPRTVYFGNNFKIGVELSSLLQCNTWREMILVVSEKEAANAVATVFPETKELIRRYSSLHPKRCLRLIYATLTREMNTFRESVQCLDNLRVYSLII